MTQMGHEERFPPLSPSDRCGFPKGTFAGPLGNGEVASEAVILSPNCATYRNGFVRYF
jgi:hypothetical protein